MSIEITEASPAFLYRTDGAEIGYYGSLELYDFSEELSDTIAILTTKYNSDYTATAELDTRETKRLVEELVRILADRGEAEWTRYVPSKDQGVCPEGHPCHLETEIPQGYRRVCNSSHDGGTTLRAGYIGQPLLDHEYRVALTDQELEGRGDR